VGPNVGVKLRCGGARCICGEVRTSFLMTTYLIIRNIRPVIMTATLFPSRHHRVVEVTSSVA